MTDDQQADESDPEVRPVLEAERRARNYSEAWGLQRAFKFVDSHSLELDPGFQQNVHEMECTRKRCILIVQKFKTTGLLG